MLSALAIVPVAGHRTLQLQPLRVLLEKFALWALRAMVSACTGVFYKNSKIGLVLWMLA